MSWKFHGELSVRERMLRRTSAVSFLVLLVICGLYLANIGKEPSPKSRMPLRTEDATRPIALEVHELHDAEPPRDSDRQLARLNTARPSAIPVSATTTPAEWPHVSPC